MKIGFYEIGEVDELNLKYAVICAAYKDKWVFVRHRDRKTWEIPGGRREVDEPIDHTALRELYEETGAVKQKMRAICDYSVTSEAEKNYGRLYYAEIQELGTLPESEIGEIRLFQDMPENLTYPLIQPYLFQRVIEEA